jgi:hypothetical protein
MIMRESKAKEKKGGIAYARLSNGLAQVFAGAAFKL